MHSKFQPLHQTWRTWAVALVDEDSILWWCMSHWCSHCSRMGMRSDSTQIHDGLLSSADAHIHWRTWPLHLQNTHRSNFKSLWHHSGQYILSCFNATLRFQAIFCDVQKDSSKLYRVVIWLLYNRACMAFLSWTDSLKCLTKRKIHWDSSSYRNETLERLNLVRSRSWCLRIRIFMKNKVSEISAVYRWPTDSCNLLSILHLLMKE